MSIRSFVLPLLLIGSTARSGRQWLERGCLPAVRTAAGDRFLRRWLHCWRGGVAAGGRRLSGDARQPQSLLRSSGIDSLVERLGRQAAAQGGRLLIGDLAQPRGGPMPNGHRSHQSGLDVDIWFLQQPRDQILSRSDTEQIEMPSMIRATEGALNDSRWSSRYRDALKRAAQAPEVERIFVNAIIKQALCDSETDRSWLDKVRPWWGHDAHFHVRLNCPLDSGQCKPQKPFSPGDGCDADLANWVRDIRQAALSPKPYKKPEPPSAENLPAACSAVLYSPTASRR
jgi:penicillin-insensitive murein endopeptidase